MYSLRSKTDTRETLFVDGTIPNHPRMSTEPKKSSMALITYNGEDDLIATTVPDIPKASSKDGVSEVISTFVVNIILGGLQPSCSLQGTSRRATIVRSLPVIYVRIRPDEIAEFIRGILDTSSEVNIMPEEYAKDNGLPIMPLDEIVNSKGIHSTIVPFYRRVTKRLYVAGRWTLYEFIVMLKRHMDAILLLGMAFISDT